MEGYTGGKPDTSWWMSQIRQGLEFRKKYTHESRWKVWREYYRGNWNNDILASNIFFRMIRTVVPRIYFRNPSVSIISRKPGFEGMAFAQVLERVDNKLLRTMRVKQHMKAIVQDAFMFGTGIGKLGFGAQYTPTPGAIETVKQREKGAGGGLVEYHADVRDNMPWFMRVPTGGFIVPKGIEYLRASPWAAHWVKRPLDEVKSDPRLKNVIDLTPSSISGSKMGNVSRSIDQIDLVEIRDKRRQKVIVLAPFSGGEKAVLYDDDALQYDGGLPFYDVVFNADDEVFWGIPDSQILEPLQLELNEIRTLMMKHRRLSIVRIIAKLNSISTEEAAKLVSETVSPVVWTQDDPSRAIKIMESGGIPKDIFIAEDSLNRDVRETMGFSRNEFGEFASGSGDTTATEAQIVKMASEIRVDERRDMLADVLVDMISDMHPVIFNQWSDDQIIDIVGPMGIQVWVKFKGQMLGQGQYDINIDPDTSVPETRQIREQRAMSSYKELKQNPLIDPMQLTKYLLTELKGTAFDTMIRNGFGTVDQPIDLPDYAQAVGQIPQELGGAQSGPA